MARSNMNHELNGKDFKSFKSGPYLAS